MTDPKPLSAEEIAGFQEVAEGISTFQDNDYVAEGMQRLLATLAERDREIERLRSLTPDIVNYQDEHVIPSLEQRIAELEGALERISHAKPDRLDHAIDCGIIERAASIARKHLEGK